MRYVMRCHVLHAHRACPVAPSSIGPSFLEFPSVACGGRPGVGAPFQPARPCPVARPLALSRPLPQAEEENSSVLLASSKPYPSASCMSFPLSRFVPLRSIRPAAGQAVRRDPNSRVSCAGGRVSAPARFARLIARARLRARARRRAHFARWPNRGLFSRRRETGVKPPPDGASFLRPDPDTLHHVSSINQDYFR